MCFSKTLSPRLRSIIQVILISILYVLARMVVCQEQLLEKKKTDRPQPGAHLLNQNIRKTTTEPHFSRSMSTKGLK